MNFNVQVLFLALIVNTVLTLPKGMVYLSEFAPKIRQVVRYFGEENFIGANVKGYYKAEAIMSIEAAERLKSVADEMERYDFSLVVYDAYRPQKAVDNFVEWSTNSEQKMKKFYFPYVDKEKVFDLGYVAKKSGHTRASTVDLTIIHRSKTPSHFPSPHKRILADGREILFLDDNTMDMYTSFDLFDEASHHDTKLIPEEYLEKRNFLRSAMKKHGFNDYPYEWWHYTLDNEPYPETYFDFDIE
jgi:D-alanyl-D-alanine dipeptidase